MTELLKLDASLPRRLSTISATRRRPNPTRPSRSSCSSRAISRHSKTLGFSTSTVMANEAIGTVRFADLPTLAQHPTRASGYRRGGRTARRPRQGGPRHPREGVDRRTTLATDGLWFADVNCGTLTGTGGATGKDVIVAVIDTGIDVTHPMFNKAISPHYNSRILRIWDMGLIPKSGEAGPDANLLVSAVTYGVEYQTQAINDAHQRVPVSSVCRLDFSHRDCVGHGTHVTSIAAGGPTHASSADAALRRRRARGRHHHGQVARHAQRDQGLERQFGVPRGPCFATP